MADPGHNVFSDGAVRRIRESVRRTEQELVGDVADRRARRRHAPRELVYVELKTSLVEGTDYGAVGHLLTPRWLPSDSGRDPFERLDDTDPDNLVSVQDRPGLDQIRGMFRGVAFGYETGALTNGIVTIEDPGASKGDVVACMRTWNPDIGTDQRGAWEYHAISGGCFATRGVAVTAGAAGSEVRVDVSFGNAGDGRIARLWKCVTSSDVIVGDALDLAWDSADCTWRATKAGNPRTLFEVTQDLVEGGTAATAYLLDSAGARTATSVSIEPSPYEAGSAAVGPFRGVAFAAEGSGSGLRGDVVEAFYLGSEWIAVGSGRTGVTGTVADDLDVGATGTVTVDTADDRTIEVQGYALCAITAGAVDGKWNGPEQRWDIKPKCRTDELTAGCGIEISDDGVISVNAADLIGPGLIPSGECGIAVDPDGECCGDGGGGDGDTPGNDGLPPGVTCDPRVCCDEEDAELSVTDCEEFAAAPERYWIPLPRIVCVEDCATGHEPDEDGNTLDGVYVENPGASCTWVTETFECDESTWFWELTLSADGSSWLKLWKDGSVFLQYTTAQPWCPRCENELTIYCPPSECHDAPEKLCVKPVCTECEDGPAYEIDVTAEDAVNTTSLDWDAPTENTGTSEVDATEGYPAAPSRKVTLTYGTMPGVVDGVAVFDEYEDIAFDPENCEVELTEICLAFLWVKTDIDDSDTGAGSPARGIMWGVGCKQGASYYVAPLGSSYVREDNWIKLSGRHLQSTDFHEITTTGIDTSSHPDWTTGGTVFTFGIVAYQEDDAGTNETITAVGHYDRAEIQLAPYECAGDPPATTCPEAVSFTACVDPEGEDQELIITIENEGDTEFNVEEVTLSASLNEFPCLFTYTISTGVVPARGSRDVCGFFVPVTAAKECCGEVRIRTSLDDPEDLCVVRVCITVLEDCDPADACALFHDDQRDYEADPGPNQAPGTELSQLVAANDFEPYNDGLLEYSDTLLECNSSTGATVTAEDVENETKAGGGAQFNSSTNLSGERAVIQPMAPTAAAFPANFAAKAAIGLDITSYTHAIGYAFGVVAADNWWGIAQSRFMADGPSFCAIVLLRQRPGELREVVERYSTDAGIAVVGIHVVAGKARIVLQNGTSNAGTSLLDSGDVTYTFTEEPVLEGTGFGLLRMNGEADERGANNSYWGELCITDQPGIAPIWEQDPP